MWLCVADPAARASKKKKQAVIPDSVKREMDLLQPAARSSVSGSSFTRSLRASRVRDDRPGRQNDASLTEGRRTRKTSASSFFRLIDRTSALTFQPANRAVGSYHIPRPLSP